MIHFLSLVFFFVLSPLFSQAATIEVRDPCFDQMKFKKEVSFTEEKSVGQFSVEVFDLEKIPYIGSELGMNSILDTPVGEPSMEFPEPGTLKVYGWCYSLNGMQPVEMPDKVKMKVGDQLVWFYGYALWKDREWKTYCSPAFENPLKVYCEKK